MKQGLLFLFIAITLSCYSQDPSFKRSAIFFEETGKFPAELSNVRNWLIDFTSQLPYMYKNGKASPKGDAEFRQFSLNATNKKTFEIGNSASYLEFDTSAVKGRPQNVQYEGKWRIAAYDPSFQLNKFKPTDNEQIFTTSLFIYNISEEQALARFLNNYVSDKQYSPMQQFIADAEQWSGKKLDVKDYENVKLKAVAQEIYSKTSEYASSIGYKIYLKNKDTKKECANLRGFFSSFATRDAISDFLDIATPEGKFYFQSQTTSLLLPANIFMYMDTKNKPVSSKDILFKVYFDYVSYKILYDDARKPYFNLKFEKLQFKNEIPPFQLVNEYKLNKNAFKVIPFRERRTFKASDVKEINIQLYDDYYKACITMNEGYGSERSFIVTEKKIAYK